MKISAPKSEKELAEANLYQPGIYDYEVLNAEDRVSKTSQKEMVWIKLKVFNNEGNFIFVDDYMVDGTMEHKIRHLCDASGMLKNYEAGEIDPSLFIGKSGRVKIGIAKDKTGQYPDKNSVVDYVVSQEAAGDDLNDSLPF